MTSAPRSDSTWLPWVPAMIWPSSRMRTPSSGCDITCFPKRTHAAAPLGSQAESPRDDVALNLRRAAADHGEPRVAEEALHRVFHAIAVAAENLQPEVGHRLVGFAGVELEHGRVAARRLPLRHEPGEAVDQRARHVEHELHVGELVRDRLELADRPAELLAALGIVERVFERRRGRAGAG